jgi:hypothetical protein
MGDPRPEGRALKHFGRLRRLLRAPPPVSGRPGYSAAMTGVYTRPDMFLVLQYLEDHCRD